MIKPDALSAIAHKIDREWGCSGYSVRRVEHGPLWGGAIAEVWASDGAVFWVASDRYGNTRHGDTHEECVAAIQHFADNVPGAFTIPADCEHSL